MTVQGNGQTGAADEVDTADYEGDVATSLVEVGPGLAVLYGDVIPPGMHVVPFALMPEKSMASLTDAVSKATGTVNLAAQGVNGAMQARGLVRLAPETLKALETAKPLMNGGWNLGTLASEGKFVAQVRWLPAGGATTASVVASVGPALAMLAIQMQLSEITKLSKHTLELTAITLDEARIARRSRNEGSYATLAKSIAEARSIGSVPPALYKEVRGLEATLDSNWREAKELVERHVTSLRAKTGHEERQRHLRDHAESMLGDAHVLMLAQTSWFMHQALRAGHLLDTIDDDPRNHVLLDRVVAGANQRHEEALAETEWLLEQLGRELGLMAALAGKITVPVVGRRGPSREVSRVARAMEESLAALRGREASVGVSDLAPAPVSIFEGEVPTELLRVLPYRLTRGERVLALADATLDGRVRPLRDSGWVAITDHRVLIMKQDDFRRYGSIAESPEVHTVRYVRVRADNSGGPKIDLVTRERDFTLRFGAWAASENQLPQVRAFGALLAHFMNTPAEERPSAEIEQLRVRGILPDDAGEAENSISSGESHDDDLDVGSAAEVKA